MALIGFLRNTMPEPEKTPPTAKTSSPFASWRIDHAGIRVPDFDEAVAWYTSTLDFRLLKSVSIGKLTFGFIAPATDDSFSFEILAGPGAAERPRYEDFHDSYNLSGWHHLGIRVDDVDATVDELRRRGVKIVSAPHDVESLQLRLAFFADPWGNLLEVISPIKRNVT
ncbi:VOC family protein [Caulobacter sp. S45]|uniref:VOC family protein n=1 Tax=Caulobacter sp. S45 TaxID=1641861 RepID=UPI001C202440|nr:VOC family protein [Caulobacter sp. S45]